MLVTLQGDCEGARAIRLTAAFNGWAAIEERERCGAKAWA
jgi:hypothetical protein